MVDPGLPIFIFECHVPLVRFNGIIHGDVRGLTSHALKTRMWSS